MAGQPRRVFEYALNLQTLNDWVSISSFVLGFSILLFVINFVWSTVIVREREERNPWQSRGLEWQIASPPPPQNFEHIPVVLSAPYDYGVKDAQPVADLNPPVGVISAAIAGAAPIGAEA
jgi:cytochrome c oxidase subunit I